MNRNPDCSGISRYWKPGEDDRCALHAAVRRRLGPATPRYQVDAFLDSLWEVLSGRRRTKFVGVGAFEWRPWRKRIPTGRMVETWRLAFKPSRYAEKYKGE